MSLDLTGQVALVTGASRGIGRFLAMRLAACGAAVAISARSLDTPSSTGETLQGTADAIRAAGGHALAVPAQITDAAQAEALVRRTVEELGRVDILVNNAGVYPRGPMHAFPADEWRAMMDINVNALFYLCRYTLPVMMAQRSGKIINVSSNLASRYYPDRVAYSVSKAAVDRLTVNLAEEVREYGVEVNSWAPGLTATDLTQGRGEPVEAVEESFMWLLAQPRGLTGQVLRRTEFGQTWGPGPGADTPSSGRS